jgi:hypothetical protein
MSARVPGDAGHAVIYAAEQFNDKILSAQAAGSRAAMVEGGTPIIAQWSRAAWLLQELRPNCTSGSQAAGFRQILRSLLRGTSLASTRGSLSDPDFNYVHVKIRRLEQTR